MRVRAVLDALSAAPAPAHQRLRLATRREHQQAEDTPVMRALMSGALDRHGYARLLLAHRDFYRRWEQHRGPWFKHDSLADWRYESRCDALQDDLSTLHCAVASVAPPATQGPPAVATCHAGWGELYVVEGSALGGQVLARLLTQRFPDLPHHFFRFGQRHGRPSWRSFQAMLDLQLHDETPCLAAIDGARTMFAQMQRMLERVDPTEACA